MLTDTHCHLDMLENLDDVLARARAAGVTRAVTIGESMASSEWAAAASARRDEVWATVGIHPHNAKDRTDEAMARLAELARRDRVVGVGEAGLDYHYDNSPRPEQRAVFAEHVRLARETGKALVIHTREAWDDTFSILADEGTPDRVVFHCFTGGPMEAERALVLGAALSFSGIVTFPSAGDLRAAARITPLDRLVVETDSPFLTPVPHRGSRNEPALVRLVAEAVAAEHGVSFEEVAGTSTAVAEGLFGLPGTA